MVHLGNTGRYKLWDGTNYGTVQITGRYNAGFAPGPRYGDGCGAAGEWAKGLLNVPYFTRLRKSRRRSLVLAVWWLQKPEALLD